MFAGAFGEAGTAASEVVVNGPFVTGPVFPPSVGVTGDTIYFASDAWGTGPGRSTGATPSGGHRGSTAVRAATSKARRCLANPDDFAGSLARTTDHAGDNFRRVQQRLWREMRIPLRHPRRGVAEQPLHHVERDTPVHEQACKRVASNCSPHLASA